MAGLLLGMGMGWQVLLGNCVAGELCLVGYILCALARLACALLSREP